jgi:hypothetical protein
MRPFLRKAGLALALGSLVFWFSCERHHVGELEGDHHTENKDAPHEHSSNAEQPAATTHTSHPSPTTEPRNSPANFFPEKKKP